MSDSKKGGLASGVTAAPFVFEKLRRATRMAKGVGQFPASTVPEVLQPLIQTLPVHKEQPDLSGLDVTKAHVFKDWFSAGGGIGK